VLVIHPMDSVVFSFCLRIESMFIFVFTSVVYKRGLLQKVFSSKNEKAVVTTCSLCAYLMRMHSITWLILIFFYFWGLHPVASITATCLRVPAIATIFISFFGLQRPQHVVM
jgi:hypothetical protein